MRRFNLLFLAMIMVGCSSSSSLVAPKLYGSNGVTHVSDDDFMSQVTVIYRTKKRPESLDDKEFLIKDTSAKKTERANEMCQEKGMSEPVFIDGICYKDDEGFYCTQKFQCKATKAEIDKWHSM